MQQYGFVGAGQIAAAIVEGLSADVADPPRIFLSPRGRRVGRELASRFPNVQVCGSNQEVLENTSSVVLTVRPPIARAVLAELSFRRQHVVMSAMAGVPLERLHDWAAPADHIVRVIPLPSAARGQSRTVMYPDNAVARELFGAVGGVLVPAEEETFDAFSAATATFAAHLDYLTTIAKWLADQGVDDDAAAAYTMHIFGQLGQSLLQRTDSLSVLTDRHMTPGGTNEQLMTDLRRDGVPDAVRRALDRVLARLREQPTDHHRPDVRLRALQRGTTVEAALAFYDGLEPVGVEDMVGSWRGEGLPTGHPFDGLLETLGWHGKRFDDPASAYPLVFEAGGGRRVSVNPAFVPVAVVARHPRLLHTPLAARLFSAIRPLIATRKPKARLRLTQYRGVVTATMCYDALPINDVFRKVDGDTLVGAMDLRGLDVPFLFVLRRERQETAP